MPTRLVLVRHGQSVGNAEHRIQGHLDTPLTPAGNDQSQRLAARLASEPIDALYSSPLRRARATADAIGRRLGLPIQEDPDLRERAAGDMTGLTHEDIRHRLDGDAASPFNPPRVHGSGVEPKTGFRARVIAALERIVRAQQNRTVVIATHRGVIDAACVWALNMPDARFAFSNASVTIIEVAVTDGKTLRPWLVMLNETSHLSTLSTASA